MPRGIVENQATVRVARRFVRIPPLRFSQRVFRLVAALPHQAPREQAALRLEVAEVLALRRPTVVHGLALTSREGTVSVFTATFSGPKTVGPACPSVPG